MKSVLFFKILIVILLITLASIFGYIGWLGKVENEKLSIKNQVLQSNIDTLKNQNANALKKQFDELISEKNQLKQKYENNTEELKSLIAELQKKERELDKANIEFQAQIKKTGNDVTQVDDIENEINNIDEIDFSDWHVYRNEEYGFEIKFPENWELNYRNKLNVSDAIITLTSPQTRSGIEQVFRNPTIVEYPSADIILYVYSGSLDTYFKEKGPGLLMGEKEKFLFNGHIAFKIVEGGFGKYFVVYIEKNNQIYRIFFENKWLESDLNLIEKQILLSFKFI